MSDAVNAGGKQRAGFQPGKSGNPRGKAPGTRNKTTMAVEALLEGQAEALTQAAIAKALEGDGAALRLCLDRIAPVRKGAPVRFDLPPVETAGDLAAAMGALVQAMAQGELSPDEAATAAGVLELRRRAIETMELEARLSALEAKKK